MRVPTSLLWMLSSAALAAAGGVVKLDSPPKAQWVDVSADPLITTLSAEKAAKWVLVDEGPLAELRPAADGKTATFAARTPGQYRVLVVAGEDVHRVRVVVPDAPQPMPPGPGPGPAPKPPEPPKPPAPVDPLVKLLQTGYDLDIRAADAKRADLADLVELYRQAGTLAADPAVTTTGQLVTRVRDAAKALGITGLAECRKVIGAELAAVFPEDVTLAAESRAKAAALFKRIQAALEAVK